MSIYNSIEKVISAEILRSNEDNLIANRICNTSFVGDIKNRGDSVTFIGLSEPTVYSYEGTLDYEDISDSGVVLSIDQDMVFSFMVKDLEELRSSIGLKDSQTKRASYEAELKKREEALKEAESNKPGTGNTGNTSASDDTPGNTGGNEDNNSMLNPAELAKDIVSQYATGKTLSTQAENFAVLKYLRNLKREGIDEAYYDSLVSNLKALGFTGANVNYNTLLDTVNDSIENYYRLQEELYNLYLEKGFSPEIASAGSKDRAQGLQYEYLYRHSPSISFFELAVYAADLDLDHLETFYSHVETNRRDPNEYDIVLGGALKH